MLKGQRGGGGGVVHSGEHVFDGRPEAGGGGGEVTRWPAFVTRLIGFELPTPFQKARSSGATGVEAMCDTCGKTGFLIEQVDV